MSVKFRENPPVQTVLCLKFKDLKANAVDPDEMAHYEPSYLDL